jgi:hypothetical protein
MTLSAWIGNAWDVDAAETWDHPLTAYTVGPRWAPTPIDALGPNVDVRGLIGPTDLNGDACPDVVGLPAFAQHILPSTGIHLWMNGTCTTPGRRVELRSRVSDQPAFGSLVTVRSGEERYTMGVASGGGAGSHRSSADLDIPEDVEEIEVVWPSGRRVTYRAPFAAVLRD